MSVCVRACVWVCVSVFVYLCAWMSEDNFWESLLFLHHVGLWHWEMELRSSSLATEPFDRPYDCLEQSIPHLFIAIPGGSNLVPCVC